MRKRTHSPVDAFAVEALDELARKSLSDIQRETAYKWAGRACAAVALGLDEDAHEYAHEALEHSALCEDQRVMRAVRRAFAACGVKP